MPNTKPKQKATCHPECWMTAKGLCRKCWQRQYQKNNPQKWRDYGLKAQRKLRDAILDKFEKKCKRCGFSDVRALQIDHVNGGGIRELKTLGRNEYYHKVLEDSEGLYQLLCANCNWIKRYEICNGEFDARLASTGEAGLAEPGKLVESAAIDAEEASARVSSS